MYLYGARFGFLLPSCFSKKREIFSYIKYDIIYYCFIYCLDSNSEITMFPQPTEDEIQFILDALAEYLTVKVRRSDVKSAWSGIRPLALDPNENDTSNALRDHVVHVDGDGVITITGGKWTTYRLMAQDAIDCAVKSAKFEHVKPCSTASMKLVGAAGWSPALFTEVAQNYTVPHRPGAIDTRVAKYLAAAYGGSQVVSDLASWLSVNGPQAIQPVAHSVALTAFVAMLSFCTLL